MPYTVNDMRTTIFRSGSYNGAAANAPATLLGVGGALNPGDADQHGMVPPGRYASASDQAHPDGIGRLVSFTNPTGAGDAVFLPFFANNICSAVVPTSPASHVDYFFTAELSGCAVYIDRVTAVPPPRPGVPALIAVGDLIVYHANALSRCANQATIMANPAASAQVPARNHMRNVLYQAGAADYTAPSPGGAGLTLQRVGICERSVYLLTVEAEMARKRAQGRTNVGYTCGTNVMGFRIGAAWQFWYQTWGWVTYERPEKTAAKFFYGEKKKAKGDAKIWDVGRIL